MGLITFLFSYTLSTFITKLRKNSPLAKSIIIMKRYALQSKLSTKTKKCWQLPVAGMVIVYPQWSR